MAKIAKYLLYAGLGIAALITWALSGQIGKYVGKSTVENYRQEKKQGKIEAVLEKVLEKSASEIKKQLPIKIDETTTLVGIIGSDRDSEARAIRRGILD